MFKIYMGIGFIISFVVHNDNFYNADRRVAKVPLACCYSIVIRISETPI